jgi:hypothetical protein
VVKPDRYQLDWGMKVSNHFCAIYYQEYIMPGWPPRKLESTKEWITTHLLNKLALKKKKKKKKNSYTQASARP